MTQHAQPSGPPGAADGDQIRAGNISNSVVAIGRHAQVQINYYPIELQAPLRRVFDPLIENRTRLFAGRADVFDQIAAWIGSTPSGYFALTAPAGFGKTALMANLVHRQPDAFAYHFFSAVYGPETLSERFFLANVVEQMAAWHDHQGKLPDQVSELQALYQQFLSAPLARTQILVLDGLDEVTTWQLAPYLGRRLPDNLHIILTIRDVGQDWQSQYQLPPDQIMYWPLGGLNPQEVAQVLEAAGGAAVPFARDADLLGEVTRVAAYADDPGLGADPFFIHVLAEDAARGQLSRTQLTQQLPGLEAYLDGWWQEVRKQAGDEATRDLFGTLTGALGPIDAADLTAINPSLVDSWEEDYLQDTVLRKVDRWVVGQEETGYALAHPRLRQYMQGKIKTEPYRQKLLAYCARWPEYRSRYALRYYAQHLADRIADGEQAQRSALTQQLIDLVLDDAFQAAHLQTLNDLPALQRDLDLALQAAALNVPTQDAETLTPLVRCALGQAAFVEQQLQPDPLFALANAGELDVALGRLGLFPAEAKWRDAAALALAWVALAAEPEQARAVVDDVLSTTQEGILHWLGRRILAALAGEPFDPPQDALPPPPPDEFIQRLLNRFGGAPLPSGLEPINQEGYMPVEPIAGMVVEGMASGPIDEYLAAYTQPPHTEVLNFGLENLSGSDMGPVFVASIDGLYLAAYSLAEPDAGRRYFERYIDLHASNSYVYYRNVSLWFLLDAALRHPDHQWVRPIVERIVRAALAGGDFVFREALPFAVAAARAKTGDATAAKWLNARRTQALADAALLEPEEGKSDLQGRHRRTLAALAEAYTLLDQPQTVDELLHAAMNVPRGYAGYMTTASLALAEAIAVAQASTTASAAEALDQAHRSAHNIQEAVFCARSTARVNAMRARWWHVGGIFAIAETAARLMDEPGHPDFAAQHLVGETYAERDQAADSLPLPDAYYTADQMAQLAETYQRPLAEFERLNRTHGWTPDQSLPLYQAVNVPDPDFAPYLAARIAAAALTAPELDAAARTAAMQRLVYAAAGNPTVLDSVLARLVLATAPAAAGVLADLWAMCHSKE